MWSLTQRRVDEMTTMHSLKIRLDVFQRNDFENESRRIGRRNVGVFGVGHRRRSPPFTNAFFSEKNKDK